jgi:DNA-binding GntR family transcriptional regulator
MPADKSIQLSLEPGTPYILLIETHYTAGGEAVAYSEIHVDDAYVRFHVVRHH